MRGPSSGAEKVPASREHLLGVVRAQSNHGERLYVAGVGLVCLC